MSALPPSVLGPGVMVAATHPCGLVALVKPAGVRTHPNKNGRDPKALLTVPWHGGDEVYRWEHEGQRGEIYLGHRLDSPTSGILFAATDAPLAKALRAAFAQRQVAKTYLALVRGVGPARPSVWKDVLKTSGGQGQVRTARGGNEPAETAVGRAERFGGSVPLSLLELQPRTGRTHQLRVQCQLRQLPIIGDATYGDFRVNRALQRQGWPKRLFLHALRVAVTLKLPVGNVSFCAEAPLPDDFATTLKRLRGG